MAGRRGSVAEPLHSIEYRRSARRLEFVDDQGVPVKLARGDTLVYRVKISPARNSQGIPVASPVLDDVSAIYFLPNARVLLKERVNQ